MATREKKKLTFEDKLARLEEIIRTLEGGRIPLEESIRQYEEGTRLTQELEQELSNAQQRLTVLRQHGDGGMTEETLTLPGMEVDEDADV